LRKLITQMPMPDDTLQVKAQKVQVKSGVDSWCYCTVNMDLT